MQNRNRPSSSAVPHPPPASASSVGRHTAAINMSDGPAHNTTNGGSGGRSTTASHQHSIQHKHSSYRGGGGMLRKSKFVLIVVVVGVILLSGGSAMYFVALRRSSSSRSGGTAALRSSNSIRLKESDEVPQGKGNVAKKKRDEDVASEDVGSGKAVLEEEEEEQQQQKRRRAREEKAKAQRLKIQRLLGELGADAEEAADVEESEAADDQNVVNGNVKAAADAASSRGHKKEVGEEEGGEVKNPPSPPSTNKNNAKGAAKMKVEAIIEEEDDHHRQQLKSAMNSKGDVSDEYHRHLATFEGVHLYTTDATIEAILSQPIIDDYDEGVAAVPTVASPRPTTTTTAVAAVGKAAGGGDHYLGNDYENGGGDDNHNRGGGDDENNDDGDRHRRRGGAQRHLLLQQQQQQQQGRADDSGNKPNWEPPILIPNPNFKNDQNEGVDSEGNNAYLDYRSLQAKNITPSEAFIKYIHSHAIFVRLMPTMMPSKSELAAAAADPNGQQTKKDNEGDNAANPSKRQRQRIANEHFERQRQQRRNGNGGNIKSLHQKKEENNININNKNNPAVHFNGFFDVVDERMELAEDNRRERQQRQQQQQQQEQADDGGAGEIGADGFRHRNIAHRNNNGNGDGAAPIMYVGDEEPGDNKHLQFDPQHVAEERRRKAAEDAAARESELMAIHQRQQQIEENKIMRQQRYRDAENKRQQREEEEERQRALEAVQQQQQQGRGGNNHRQQQGGGGGGWRDPNEGEAEGQQAADDSNAQGDDGNDNYGNNRKNNNNMNHNNNRRRHLLQHRGGGVGGRHQRQEEEHHQAFPQEGVEDGPADRDDGGHFIQQNGKMVFVLEGEAGGGNLALPPALRAKEADRFKKRHELAVEKRRLEEEEQRRQQALEEEQQLDGADGLQRQADERHGHNGDSGGAVKSGDASDGQDLLLLDPSRYDPFGLSTPLERILNRHDSTQHTVTTYLTQGGGSSSPKKQHLLPKHFSPTHAEEVRPLVLLVPINAGYFDFGLNLLCSLEKLDDDLREEFGPIIHNASLLAKTLRAANPSINGGGVREITMGGSGSGSNAAPASQQQQNGEDAEESGGSSTAEHHISEGDGRLLEHLLSSVGLKMASVLFPQKHNDGEEGRGSSLGNRDGQGQAQGGEEGVDAQDAAPERTAFIKEASLSGLLQKPMSGSAGQNQRQQNDHQQKASSSSASSSSWRGLVFTSMDTEVHKQLKQLRLPVFHDPQIPFISKSAAAWGHESFHALVCSKLVPVIRILKSGVDVVFSDADIAFVKPFLPLLRPLSEVSVQFSIGSCHKTIEDNANLVADSLKKFNTGFYYVKATPQMIRLMEKGYNSCANSHLTGDQPALNGVIQEDIEAMKQMRSAIEAEVKKTAASIVRLPEDDDRAEELASAAGNKKANENVDKAPLSEHEVRLAVWRAKQRARGEEVGGGGSGGSTSASIASATDLAALSIAAESHDIIESAIAKITAETPIYSNFSYRYGFFDGCLFANGCTYFKGLCKADVYDEKYIRQTMRRDEGLISATESVLQARERIRELRRKVKSEQRQKKNSENNFDLFSSYSPYYNPFEDFISSRFDDNPHYADHSLLESSSATPRHLRDALHRASPVMVHANFLVGKKDKVQHLRKNGLWFDHCIAEYKRKLV